MDIPYYVEAAMVGALAGYGATPSGMVVPSVNFVTTKMASALIGALTVTAGKVVFGWIPRIQPVSVAAGTGMGGGGGRFGAMANRGGGFNPLGGGRPSLWFDGPSVPGKNPDDGSTLTPHYEGPTWPPDSSWTVTWMQDYLC